MNNFASIFATILVISMAIVYAANDSQRIVKHLNDNHTFRKLSNKTVAITIALFIYLPPLGLFFLPSIVFRKDSEILLCSGGALGILWIFVGYLMTGGGDSSKG